MRGFLCAKSVGSENGNRGSSKMFFNSGLRADWASGFTDRSGGNAGGVFVRGAFQSKGAKFDPGKSVHGPPTAARTNGKTLGASNDFYLTA